MGIWKGIATIGVIALLLLAGVLLWVRGDIREIAAKAQLLFPGDRVEALSALALSEKHGFKVRNRAIWALGHLGDARALSALEQLETHAPCDHKQQICQYELEKALASVRGEDFTLFHNIASE